MVGRPSDPQRALSLSSCPKAEPVSMALDCHAWSQTDNVAVLALPLTRWVALGTSFPLTTLLISSGAVILPTSQGCYERQDNTQNEAHNKYATNSSGFDNKRGWRKQEADECW